MSFELPALPEPKYEVWDDYYDGYSLIPMPEDRFGSIELWNKAQVDAIQLAAYRAGRLAGLEEAAKACEAESLEDPPDNPGDEGYMNAIRHSATAIRALKEQAADHGQSIPAD